MQDFRKLIIWQKGMAISKEVYSVAKQLPKSQLYILSSQIIRSAISIPSNIAEGSSRFSKKDFARFLEIAQGSAFELETQLILVKDFNLIENIKIEAIIDELSILQKMINAFRKKVLTKNSIQKD